MVENTSDPSRFPKEAMSIPSSTCAHPFALRHLAGAALLACALAAQAQPAPAQVRAYDLPAQPLGSTLARIAAEGGQQLSIDADLVRALTAPAVRGRFTPEQAARAALAGSGLELVRTEGGNWGLRRLPAGANSSGAAQASSSASSLAEVRVTAQADRSGTTEGTGSYQATASTTATKFRLSPRETPQTVTTITRQQMDDTGMTSVNDALKGISGVFLQEQGTDGTTHFSRGFSLQAQFDGMAAPGSISFGAAPIDNAFLDRVELQLQHSLRFAANYQIPDTAWSVGGNVSATSKTHLSGTWPGPWTARNPALVLVGLNAQYQISPETQVNLVVSNLTDRTYRHLRSLNSSSFGEPRKFTVTLKHRF